MPLSQNNNRDADQSGGSVRGGPATATHTHTRIGIMADPHYADVDSAGNRCYRESLEKLEECCQTMNNSNVDFMVNLGDSKDQDSTPVQWRTMTYLRKVIETFFTVEAPCHHVLGNHDLDSISKKQFLTIAKTTTPSSFCHATYYAFDQNDIHFVILDANYLDDGSHYNQGNFDWTNANIPSQELEWLRIDLASTNFPTVVFIHQQLDGEGEDNHTVNNAPDVRYILETYGHVLAVFQGHNHGGSYRLSNGIHYFTLNAMVEGRGLVNNAYALIEVRADSRISVTGYGKQPSATLDPMPFSPA